MNNHVNFRDVGFLKQHIQSILDFYQTNVIDTERGGYHQNFYDNGEVFATGEKHLVSSTRMVFNYCKAYQSYKNHSDLEKAIHGLNYIRQYHWDPRRQSYRWLVENNEAKDETNHCYGLAFVILSMATCIQTGISSAEDDLYQAWDILNLRFWQKEQSIYADEASPNWQSVSSYRGQNANMHCCEALLIAYEATKDVQFLNRAYSLAKTIACTLADKSDGLVWEHYTELLVVDLEYNKQDPKNLYRPWGFQPGHQTEWCKLLLILHRYKPENWMLERAKSLFDRAMHICWDNENGGIFYGHAPDYSICDNDKYFWVQAESFAAAALLADTTNDETYWDWYNKIWQYSWQHMVDHKNGAWFRVLTHDNKAYSNQKSIAGGKCDYHTMGACWEVISILER